MSQEIKEIQFGIYSAKEIEDIAVCEIDDPKMTTMGLRGTVYDDRLGPMKKKTPCETCGGSIKDCPGHYGMIRLAEPVINPLFYKTVIEFLKCICVKCHKVLITEELIDLHNLRRSDPHAMMTCIVDKITSTNRCPGCGTAQPNIIFNTSDNQIMRNFNSAKGVDRSLSDNPLMSVFVINR